MVLIGDFTQKKCTIRHTASGVLVDGAAEGFIGYKFQPASQDNGTFAEWTVSNGRLLLRNDRMGFMPLYYKRLRDGIAFSSSLYDLVDPDGNEEIDDIGMSVFLRIGMFLSDRTPFKNIKALPPGAELRCSNAEFSLSTNRIEVGREFDMPLSKIKTVYGDLFQSIIDRFRVISAWKIGLPLSGGRDSRHILFALRRAGINPHSCMTMRHQAPKPDEDALIAATVCREVGVEHIVLDQPRSALSAEIAKNKITGFHALEHSWILPVARQLVNGRYQASFDGVGGDVLSTSVFNNSKLTSMYKCGKVEELAEELLGRDDYLSRMLAESTYKRFSRQNALDALVEELKTHLGTVNPVAQFYFWNKTRRQVTVSCWRILSQGCHVFAPFLEHEMYRFFTSIPVELILNTRIHDEVISQHYPEYAHIAYETKEMPLKANSLMTNWYQLGEYAVFFRKAFGQSSPCRPAFIYPRIAKGLLSADYFYQSSGFYKILVYLQQLSNFARLT